MGCRLSARGMPPPAIPPPTIPPPVGTGLGRPVSARLTAGEALCGTACCWAADGAELLATGGAAAAGGGAAGGAAAEAGLTRAVKYACALGRGAPGRCSVARPLRAVESASRPLGAGADPWELVPAPWALDLAGPSLKGAAGGARGLECDAEAARALDGVPPASATQQPRRSSHSLPLGGRPRGFGTRSYSVRGVASSSAARSSPPPPLLWRASNPERRRISASARSNVCSPSFLLMPVSRFSPEACRGEAALDALVPPPWLRTALSPHALHSVPLLRQLGVAVVPHWAHSRCRGVAAGLPPPIACSATDTASGSG